MSKNTSELWSVVPGFYPGFVEIFGASFKISVVTHAADIGLVESMNRIEDARRIVACVNACAGVDTALLEAGELDKPTMLVIQEKKDLKHRCDELLAALEGLLADMHLQARLEGDVDSDGCVVINCGNGVLYAANAAIAKAKGV